MKLLFIVRTYKLHRTIFETNDIIHNTEFLNNQE